MRISTLTFDRGDRKIFLDRCKMYVNRMTDDSIFITYPPESNKIDLLDRVKMGLQIAQMQGTEFVFFIESDDWYHPDYLKIMSYEARRWRADIIGFNGTVYYNVVERRYEVMAHDHSSLFATGVRVDKAIEVCNKLKPEEKFLDIYLWRWIQNRMLLNMKYHNQFLCIGIKHDMGLRAGMGHKKRLPLPDYDGSFLESVITNKEDFEFYKQFYKS